MNFCFKSIDFRVDTCHMSFSGTNMESGGWEAPDTGWGYSLLPNGDLLGGYLGVHGKEKQPKDSGDTCKERGNRWYPLVI